MKPLIALLTHQHRLIVETLEQAYKYGISTSDGQAHLIMAKDALIDHLKHEDNEFFPVLLRIADADIRLKAMLWSLEDEMRPVTAMALAFFRKYHAGGSGNEFAREFGVFSAHLRSRIRREETLLFPIFERAPESWVATPTARIPLHQAA